MTRHLHMWRDSSMKIPHPMHIVLFDTQIVHENLLPLSFTRPVSDFRVGIMTIREKWQKYCPDAEITQCTAEYLNPKFHDGRTADAGALHVAGNVVPDPDFVSAALALTPGQAMMRGVQVLAFRGTTEDLDAGNFQDTVEAPVGTSLLTYVFDIFLANAKAIEDDFRLLTEGRVSMPLSDTNTVIGELYDAEGRQRIFLEEGADVEGAVINLKTGPVYVGKDASIMEGAALRGPIALCRKACIRMGAKVYGGTTLGPYCKIGGEVDNVVLFGYSNKAHEGYLGNAVIGEWCNIGAGTNASNLKNDYSKIRIWNYATRSFMRTDLQFCGLIMGDHSKAGINCMFNTATVVGVGCNIHGAGFPRAFIPSFSEGSPGGGFTDVALDKFGVIAERMMSRRGLVYSDVERKIFEAIFDVAASIKG